jgi:hypothetical protein
MSNNKLSLTLGVTPNEYTILEALYTQILTSDWTHKMPQAGMLNNKADSPICDHLSPYHEEGIDNIPLKELLTTDRVVEYKTDDPYGVYLTIAGTNKRYSFLWNAARYSDRLFIVYQLGAKPTKNAPELGYVQGVLVRMSGMVKGCNPLFIEALRVYEQILEFHVLPRNGKEDIVPTPAEVLAILQGYGEYPDIDSVIATAAKKEAAKVESTSKSVGLKKNRKKPARIKGETFWLVFEIALPVILSLIVYGLTEHIMFTAFVGVLAALPILSRGMSLPLESEGGKSKDSNTGGSK